LIKLIVPNAIKPYQKSLLQLLAFLLVFGFPFIFAPRYSVFLEGYL